MLRYLCLPEGLRRLAFGRPSLGRIQKPVVQATVEEYRRDEGVLSHEDGTARVRSLLHDGGSLPVETRDVHDEGRQHPAVLLSGRWTGLRVRGC